MPTGCINADNLLDYLRFDKVIACGGSFMVKESLVEAEDWDAIESLTREAVVKMLVFDLHHLGINTESESDNRTAAVSPAVLSKNNPYTHHSRANHAGAVSVYERYCFEGGN